MLIIEVYLQLDSLGVSLPHLPRLMAKLVESIRLVQLFTKAIGFDEQILTHNLQPRVILIFFDQV